MVNLTEEDNIYGKMVLFTKEYSKTELDKARVTGQAKMEINTKEIIQQIEKMDLDSLNG